MTLPRVQSIAALCVFLSAGVSVSTATAAVSAPPKKAEYIQILNDSLSTATPGAGVCPFVWGDANYEVDTVSTRVDYSINMRIRVDQPIQEQGAFVSTKYKVRSSNAAVAGVALTATGSGSEVEVTIPAGSKESNRFWVRGVEVGAASVIWQRQPSPSTPNKKFAEVALATSVWNFEEDGIVDYNALGKKTKPICYDPVASPALVSDTLIKTRCGITPDFVAADGASRLLMRLKAGRSGTACFKTVNSGSFDLGSTDPVNSEAIVTDPPLDNVHWAFGTYLPPKSFESTSTSREVEVEIAFTPTNVGRTNTTFVRRKITIKRPPVLLVHGVWSDAGTWSSGYQAPLPTAGWIIQTANYRPTNAESFRSAATLATVQAQISATVEESRLHNTATTKVDVVAHSMGGLVTRAIMADPAYRRPDNFNAGDVRRLVTLTTPHWGAQIANLLINLHNSFPHGHAGLDYLETFLRENVGADVHRGAVCDLAENSAALAFSPVADVYGRAYGASDAPMDRSLHFVFRRAASEFGDQEQADHIRPYAFNVPNDALVSVASQQGGLPLVNNAGLIHFVVPWYVPGNGITHSDATARDVYLALNMRDDDGAAFGKLPAVSSLGTGVPRLPGIGRGAAIDSQNYTDQCAVGRPLRQP